MYEPTYSCSTGFIMNRTYSWQHKKQYLIDGPNIKSHGIDGKFCSASINFTHIFVAFHEETKNFEGNFFILDYDKGQWTKLPDNENPYSCQCTVTVNKHFEKMVYLFYSVYFSENFVFEIVDRFNLLSGTWKRVFSRPNPNFEFLGRYKI